MMWIDHPRLYVILFHFKQTFKESLFGVEILQTVSSEEVVNEVVAEKKEEEFTPLMTARSGGGSVIKSGLGTTMVCSVFIHIYQNFD